MSHPDPHSPDLESSAASSTDVSFAELLSEFEHAHRHAPEEGGEGRLGVVVAVSADSVFVDIGLKTEGMLAAADLRDSSGNLQVAPGDQLRVSIRGRDPEGYYLLSLIKLERPRDWAALEQAFREKRTIAGVVTGQVKGGFTVDIGVRAFLPVSRSGVKDPAEMEKLVGQEIACKIIELDIAKEDVVVDRRAVLEEEQERARRQAFEALREGEVVRGTVTRLADFGAFVDVGGVEGLLHVTDMSWGRVRKPSDVLRPGDVIEVKILKVDPEAKRLSLGLKQLTPEPWSLVEEKYRVGDRVRGTVTRLADFGAFVELEPGVEGLIHLSDLSWSKKARKPSDVLKAAETVEVVVTSVNAAERRIALSLKRALGDPWERVEQLYPVGSVVEGRVVSLAKFGAFVEITEGVEGMIHIGDISAEKRLDHPREALREGETVRAQVLEMDRARRRLRLGMKQLQPTTADEYIAEHREGDTVTGRVVEIGPDGWARVEVADRVFAHCRPFASASPGNAATGGAADLSALTAMLAAKWKQGRAPAAVVEPLRAGQVRQFRIVSLDKADRRIELEPAI
ncbi:MAG: 30S ribosomal protein S1 [Bryobacteraceae bacterium]